MLEEGIAPKKVKPEVEKRILSVGLKVDVLDKYPSELSGGMKQRVQITRASVTKRDYYYLSMFLRKIQ